MRMLLLAVTAAFATALHAGVVYRTSDHRVVSIDGPRYRIDIENAPEPHAFDAVFSTDGGATKTYLNRTLKTWYESRPDDFVKPTSRRFTAGMKTEVVKQTVESHDEPTDETLLGHPTEKHVIKIDYRLKDRIGSESLFSNVTTTVIVWTTPDFSRGSLPFDIRTSWHEVDKKVDEIVATFHGLIVREVWTVTFRYERGNAVHDSGSWEIEEIATKDVPASTFTVPKEFAHQFPVIGAPGAVSH